MRYDKIFFKKIIMYRSGMTFHGRPVSVFYLIKRTPITTGEKYERYYYCLSLLRRSNRN